MATRRDNLVSPLEEDPPSTAHRTRSRSPIRRKKSLDKRLLGYSVEELVDKMSVNPGLIYDKEQLATGREALSSEELIKQLMGEIKTATEERKIDQEVIQMKFSHLERTLESYFESVVTTQVEILEKLGQLDYSGSIRQLGENMKILDKSLKAVTASVTLMTEKVDLLYGKMAVGTSNAPMIPSCPQPQSIYPKLPESTATAPALDIVF
ncbi:phosphoprotein [Loveridge's garter snake virus 1]|uniref:Phosphoprotein n=1 Tax=Loveridge's garter snake virus 1 TaxID=1881951 RepID=A0A077ETD9_9MONO|nr:phosphoprotein [Loveridge's garter snake virus 1]AIL50414.1 phosphoprotein [Loveridge's garter snake virus 1]